MTASKHGWKVRLVPWDHLSEDHVSRMYNQRVACGWRADEVPLYVESAKKGGKIFYWILLSDAHPDRQKLLDTHVQAYPLEATPLRDTARWIQLVPREPTNEQFTPIGHIALDVHTAESDVALGLPPTGNVWIHQLYVSYALQAGGLGAAAMDQAEALSAREPFSAKRMVLDTMAKETQLAPESCQALYVDRGLKVPKMSNQEWYERRGYRVFRTEAKGYEWKHEKGVIWFPVVYMSKDLE